MFTKQQIKMKFTQASIWEEAKRTGILDLSCSIMDDDSMVQLATALNKISTLDSLNLENNAYTYHSIQILENILVGQPQLRQLYLGYNRSINDQSLAQLIACCADHPRLELLALDYCYLGPLSLQMLSVKMAQSDCRWLHLSLQGCGIDSAGSERLLKGAEQSTCLRRLNLCWNSIDKQAIQATLIHLQTKSPMLRVDLANNRIKNIPMPAIIDIDSWMKNELDLDDMNDARTKLNIDKCSDGFLSNEEWLVLYDNFLIENNQNPHRISHITSVAQQSVLVQNTSQFFSKAPTLPLSNYIENTNKATINQPLTFQRSDNANLINQIIDRMTSHFNIKVPKKLGIQISSALKCVLIYCLNNQSVLATLDNVLINKWFEGVFIAQVIDSIEKHQVQLSELNQFNKKIVLLGEIKHFSSSSVNVEGAALTKIIMKIIQDALEPIASAANEFSNKRVVS